MKFSEKIENNPDQNTESRWSYRSKQVISHIFCISIS